MKYLNQYNNLRTPYYIYDKSIIRQQIEKLVEANIKRSNIHFSLMANNNIHLLKIIKNTGIGVFVSSIQELQIALSANFKKDQIVFCSSNLNNEEIDFVIKESPIIVADSYSQLKKFISNNIIDEIAIRISLSPELYKKYNEIEIQRQGISISQIKDAINYCKINNIKIIGIHTYLGTNVRNISFYKEGLNELLNLSQGLNNLGFIDMSGGFGLDYKVSDSEFNIDEVVKHFENKRLNNPNLSKSIELKIEPGRFIMASGGKLITKVIEVNKKDANVYIGVDTNLSNFPRPYIYKESHLITAIKRKNKTESKFSNAFICGNSVKSDDFFVQNIDFPFVEEGDLLCFHYAGAYCYSMSSNFCSLLKPAEYLIEENTNKIKLIRKKESIQSYLNIGGDYE